MGRGARGAPGEALLTRARPLAATALALALAACAPRVPPPDLSLEPAALLEQVRAAQAKVRSVEGEARVSVDAPGQSGTVSQWLAAARPDRLHVETLDFFGNVAAVLVADGGRFALYDARERVYYRGRATPENLARLVPLPLTAEELVAVLCGGAPLDGEPVAAGAERGTVRLELAGPAGEATLHVGAGAAVERASQRPAGRPAWSVKGDVYRQREGARVPTDLELRAPALKVKLGLHWKELTVNGDPDPRLFRLDPPAGARVVDLDEEAGAP